MARASENPMTRRTWLWPTCALVGGMVGWVVAISGCLNPRPEDFPSRSDSEPSRDLAVPGAVETCGDNPQLAGCDPAEGNAVGLEPEGAADTDAASPLDAGVDAGP
jgi:hypothetical protein